MFNLASKKGVYKTVSFTAASVAANVCAEQDITVPGVNADMMLLAVEGPATGNGTALCGGRVKAKNTIAVSFANPTAGALTPAAGTYKFLCVSPSSNR